MEIKVLKDILGANDQMAQNNQQLLDKHNVFAVNLMASPGAGKTSLVLETIKGLGGKVRTGVIEGDISSSIDSKKIAQEGAPVVQINTGGECHLDASMIRNALDNLPLADIELLLVENVGNLVCPAEFNLGEHRKVVVSSVPEGDDKPIKYPAIFLIANAVVLNKTDLLPYVKFDAGKFCEAVRGVNRKVDIFEVSCTTGDGIDRWVSWLLAQMGRK
ncbi:MAG: hydrogenase nickel incorporation protein HypB [Dehalococcoidales bacterium]|nr:MAG: hydrogenase nickel incorporation protein HypB [Dehalococcoidales bacterium]